MLVSGDMCYYVLVGEGDPYWAIAGMRNICLYSSLGTISDCSGLLIGLPVCVCWKEVLHTAVGLVR